jgi:hypothetical protein
MDSKTYYIYHIPGVKIGVSNQVKKRIRNQKYNMKNVEILEKHSDVYKVSYREKELQKQYGYRVDTSYYWETLEAQKHIPIEARVRGGKRAYEVNGNRQGLINKENGHMAKMVQKSAEKCSKPIMQYDRDGNFIREWDSAAIAARELRLDKSSIGRTCNPNNLQLTSGGFIFKYKTIIDC